MSELQQVNLPAFEFLQQDPSVLNRWEGVWQISNRRSRKRFFDSIEPALTRYRRQIDEAPARQREQWRDDLREMTLCLTRYLEENHNGSAICALCRGSCCAQELGSGGLADPVDLIRYIDPDFNLKKFAVNPWGIGCCFRGPQGCAIPPPARPRRCAVYTCPIVINFTPFKHLDAFLSSLDPLADLPLLDTHYSFRSLVLATDIPESAWTIRYQTAVSIIERRGQRIYVEATATPESDRFTARSFIALRVPPDALPEAGARLSALNSQISCGIVALDQEAAELCSRSTAFLSGQEVPVALVRWAINSSLECVFKGYDRIADLAESA